MKQTIYILTSVFGLWGCNNNSVGKSKDTLKNGGQQYTSKIISSEKQSEISDTENGVSKDSTVYFSDSLFFNLETELKEISNSQFPDYKKEHKTNCSIDTNGFVKGKGLILSHYCNEICESYLIDQKERIKLILPSSYDQGITGLDISPSCNQVIVYSSYDGPDYTNYYEYRAEIFGFSIVQGQGIQTIKPTFKFYTKDWSIEEVIWINDNEIAFKTYEESRSIANQDKLNYKYYKTTVIK